jgi:hypothetical protein
MKFAFGLLLIVVTISIMNCQPVPDKEEAVRTLNNISKVTAAGILVAAQTGNIVLQIDFNILITTGF